MNGKASVSWTKESKVWRDVFHNDESFGLPVAWIDAIGWYTHLLSCIFDLIVTFLSCIGLVAKRVQNKMDECKKSSSPLTDAQMNDYIDKACLAYHTLSLEKDSRFLRFVLDLKSVDVPLAIARCSAAVVSPQHIIGVLVWICSKLKPTFASRFALFLKDLLEYEDDELLTEDAVRAWIAADAQTNLLSVPSSTVTEQHIMQLKTDKGMIAFIKYLDQPHVEDDEEGKVAS